MQPNLANLLVSVQAAIAAMTPVVIVPPPPPPPPTSGSSQPTSGQATPAMIPNPAVRVWNGKFVDGNNAPIQPRGVNYSGYEGASILGYGVPNASGNQDGGGATPAYDAMRNGWKCNIVRLPLNEASWLNLTTFDVTGASRKADPNFGLPQGNYQTQIKATVDAATAKGMLIILDLHWNAPNASRPGQTGKVPATPFDEGTGGQNAMADIDHSITFWTQVATMFKAYPNVLFDLFNEPYMQDWVTWLNGGTWNQVTTGSLKALTDPCVNGQTIQQFYFAGGVPDKEGNTNVWKYAYQWQYVGMQQLINAVRATGATNVVLAGGIDYAGDLTGWLASGIADPLNQLAVSWHPYPKSDQSHVATDVYPSDGLIQYTHAEQLIASGFPVLMTETRGSDGSYDGTPYMQQICQWADKTGSGITAWVWDRWGNALILNATDPTYAPSPGYATYYHNWLVNHG